MPGCIYVWHHAVTILYPGIPPPPFLLLPTSFALSSKQAAVNDIRKRPLLLLAACHKQAEQTDEGDRDRERERGRRTDRQWDRDEERTESLGHLGVGNKVAACARSASFLDTLAMGNPEFSLHKRELHA